MRTFALMFRSHMIIMRIPLKLQRMIFIICLIDLKDLFLTFINKCCKKIFMGTLLSLCDLFRECVEQLLDKSFVQNIVARKKELFVASLRLVKLALLIYIWINGMMNAEVMYWNLLFSRPGIFIFQK